MMSLSRKCGPTGGAGRGTAVRLIAAALAAWLAEPPTGRAAERASVMMEVESAGRTANLPVALTRPFERGNAAVETAIVFVHGEEGDAPRWGRELDALAKARGLDASVYVAAPQFLDEEDVGDEIDDILTARWSGGDWSFGETASRPTHILSYHVVDSVLARLGDAKSFPKLKRVTVAGFGEGGRFTQAYAAFTDAAEKLTTRGVSLRFVVGASDSYLYFGAERPTPDGGFAVPPPTDCEDYNEWPYGPREAPNALKEQDRPVRFFAERYAKRDVVYVVGDREAEPLSDGDCAGEAQGNSRAERLSNYWRYMAERWPGFDHKTVIVPKAGHDPRVFLERPGLFDILLGAPTPEPDAVSLRSTGDSL